MAASSKTTYFVVHYRDPQNGDLVTLKCRSITDSTLGLSFVKISDFIFDTSRLVVKPAEEQLREKLKNVKSLHLSIYSVISIEEVGEEHEGLQFSKDRSNLVTLPSL